MSYDRVPAGLGLTTSAADLIKQRVQNQQQNQGVDPVSLAKAKGLVSLAPSKIRVKKPTLAQKKVLRPIPVAAKRVPALAKRAPAPAMVRVSGNNAKRLSSWLSRRFGSPTPGIKGLKFETGQVVIPKIWYGRYTSALARVRRMNSKSTSISALGARSTAGRAAAAQTSAAFMVWWRNCDRDGWAAWNSAVVPGTGPGKVPTLAYDYWRQRQSIRQSGSVMGAIASAAGLPRRRGTMTQGQMQMQPSGGGGSSLIDHQEPARSMPAGPMTMGGMGQTSATLQGIRSRAQQRRTASRIRRVERSTMRTRHAAERRTTTGKSVAQLIQEARQRRAERAKQQAGNVDALVRERAQRSHDIASASGSIRSGIVASVSTALEQRRATRAVPCPSGTLKNMIFGFSTGLIAPTPAGTAADALARAREAARKHQQKLAEHKRRMEELLRKEAAADATAAASNDPVTLRSDKADGATEIDQETAKIEEATLQAEETKVESYEKEEQVIEIEAVLDDTKDLIEEGKAQLSNEKDLTPELKELQKKLDALTGALVDAKIEYEDSLVDSAEASQAQITLMKAEIERLTALLTVQPELEQVLDPYIDAYEQDILIAQDDVVDAETAMTDAMTDTADTATEAAETVDDILETEPFYVRHRNILLLGGAAAVGAGYWWWKQREMSPVMTPNDGHYNLPEPKSPKHPSGL